MSDDPDYLFALKLQQQLDAEMSNVNAELSHAKSTPQTEDDSDYQLALMLQNEVNNDSTEDNGDDSIENVSVRALDMTNNNNSDNDNITFGKDLKRRNGVNKLPSNFETYLDQTQNLVHPEWELVDPTPDIYAMFVRFDEKFFQQRLGAVSVEWSKRMYSCAGICYQRGNRFVKTVIIRLSEPLLKLRPRKDLVETLLHEMIHAYCFVLNIREGNGGHGPNFKRIMETINKVAGTNITVYHSFHDEVNAYKTHIWRCNGVCQFHHPFQGWVKRTSNRAPGPNDQWWAKHQSECGGTFEKKSEPPKPSAKPDAKPKVKAQAKPKQQSPSNAGRDIRNFFGKPKLPIQNVPNIMSTGNVAGALPPTSYPGTSSKPFEGLQLRDNKRMKTNEPNKIFGFKDLTGSDSSGDEDRRDPKGGQQTNEMQGKGYSLTNDKSSSLTNMSDASKRNHLRDMWSNRFIKNNENAEAKKEPTGEGQENCRKRRRPSTDEIMSWESYDDDIMVRDVVVPIINISDSDNEDEHEDEDVVVTTMPSDRTKRNQPSSHELTTIIKREIMEDESIYDDADIIMIDDEYDDDVDNLTAASELADQSIIDDIFGEDTLLQEFQRENDVVPSGSRNLSDAHNDITTCPICFEKMRRSEFANHLEGCSIIIRVPPPSMKGKAILPPTSNSINKGKSYKRKRNKSSKTEILKSSGYTDSEIAALNLSSSSDSREGTSDEMTPRQMRQRNLLKNTVQCPKCGQELLGHQLEAHGKICKR
ncbi:hypothetical protein ACLKA6_015505 [Drosophila palustris]